MTSKVSRFRITDRKSRVTVRTRMMGSSVVKWEASLSAENDGEIKGTASYFSEVHKPPMTQQ